MHSLSSCCTQCRAVLDRHISGNYSLIPIRFFAGQLPVRKTHLCTHEASLKFGLASYSDLKPYPEFEEYRSGVNSRHPTPDQSVYHARTQVWKTPLFADFGRKKHHFFRFWGSIKPPFLSKTRFFSSYKLKYPVVIVRIYVTASNKWLYIHAKCYPF